VFSGGFYGLVGEEAFYMEMLHWVTWRRQDIAISVGGSEVEAAIWTIDLDGGNVWNAIV
jgi:hypothetical protein